MSFVSTDKYIKIPSITTTQRNSLTAVNGMIVYDSTLNALYKYEDGAWTSFAGGGGISDAPNDANAYVRSALGWVVGYTKSALDTLLGNKEGSITAGNTSQYWRGDKSWQTLNKSAVGLGNVDNTSDSDKPVSTAQAAADTLVLNTAKSYADTLVVGLIDDRGNYDASGNVFPSTGGSGAGGGILKGDLWTVSVAGTLGGNAVTPGDLVRALVDTPGQTASNWAVTENNIGYVAENQSNKTDAMSGNTTSSTKYLSAKGVYDWVIGLGYQVALTAANFGAFINGLSAKTTPVDADAFSLIDSEDSNNAKKLTWANIKATLKSYFDTLYATTAYADKKRAYLYFSANIISPADSTTYYISFVSNVTNNGTAGAGVGKSLQLGYAAKIVGGVVTVVNTNIQGSSEDSTLLIRNVTTSTSSSIGTFKTNASVDGNNSFISKTITGASIYVAATDEIALQWNTPTYAANPAGTRIYGYLIVEF
jgi:hypothetical protein